MSSIVSDHQRAALARSIALLHANRDAIAEAMETSLAAAEEPGEAFGQAEVTAMLLLEMLLVQGRNAVDSGRIEVDRDMLAQHRALAIAGRHYSRFGDALVAILRDVLGRTLPREIPAAWCDLFWSVVREATEREPVQA